MNKKSRGLNHNSDDQSDFKTNRLSKRRKKSSKKIKTEVERRELIISNAKNKPFLDRGKKVKPKVLKDRPRIGRNDEFATFKDKKVATKGNSPDERRELKPSYILFGFAALVSLFLIYLASVDSILSESLFFIFVGIMVLKIPVFYSKNLKIDFFLLSLFLLSLSAFLPSLKSLWPAWKVTAVDVHALNLGFMNSVSPLMSLEGLIVLASLITIFYNMGSWRLNELGKKRILYVFAFISLVHGELTYRYGKEPLKIFFSNVNHFTPICSYQENATLIFLLVGLISIFLVFDGWKKKTLGMGFGFIGIIVSFLSLLRSDFNLYFWAYLAMLFTLLFSKVLKSQGRRNRTILMLVSVGLFVLTLIFNRSYTFEFLVELISDMKLSLWGLWASLVSSFGSLSFFGNGIGTSNYILPQINEFAQFSEVHSFRGTNLERFILEFGILGLISLFLFLYFSFKNRHKRSRGKQKTFRLLGSIFLLLIVGRFVFSSAQTSIGLVLFAMVLFYFTFQSESSRQIKVSRKIARLIGCFWIGLGLVWLFSSILNYPLHSEIRHRKLLSSDPKYMDFSNLIRVSEQTDLSLESISDIHPAKSFIRAQRSLNKIQDWSEFKKQLSTTQFLLPNHKDIQLPFIYSALESDFEAVVQLSYEYFKINTLSKESDYLSLIHYMKTEPNKLLQFNKISYLNPKFRYYFLMCLNDIYLEEALSEKEFLELDLLKDSYKFNYIKLLIENGLFERSDTLLELYGETISNSWYLDALKIKEQANFKKSLLILRENIEPIEINPSDYPLGQNLYLRVFLNNFPDKAVGSYLLNEAIATFNYSDALLIARHILKMKKPPLYAYYWEAELLYRLEDFEESWFSFERFYKKSEIRTIKN